MCRLPVFTHNVFTAHTQMYIFISILVDLSQQLALRLDIKKNSKKSK